jgi:hypothetical protein
MRIVDGNSATQRVAIQAERQDGENCSSLRQNELRAVFFSGRVESVPIRFKREEKMRENPNDAAIIESLAIGVETRAEINPWRQGLRRRGSIGEEVSEERRGLPV